MIAVEAGGAIQQSVIQLEAIKGNFFGFLPHFFAAIVREKGEETATQDAETLEEGLQCLQVSYPKGYYRRTGALSSSTETRHQRYSVLSLSYCHQSEASHRVGNATCKSSDIFHKI